MALTKIPRGLLDTGIADSSDATAITIDSSENVTFAGHIDLLDNMELRLGTGNDYKFDYDGSRLNIIGTGDTTIDVTGNIYLDADGGKVYLQDAGTEKLRFVMDNAGYVQIYSAVSDDDIKIQGNGKTINELEKVENIDQMLIRFLTVKVKKHDLDKVYFEN